MTDAVQVGFARSELLKKEWDRLRTEIDALDPHAHNVADRRTAIQLRMNQITTEMAAVLSQTKRAIPTPDIDEGDDDENEDINSRNTAVSRSGAEGRGGCQSPLIQYSAHNLHIVQRTYDSTDSEAEEEEEPTCKNVLVLDTDELQPQMPEERDSIPKRTDDSENSRDSDHLRKSMMHDCTSTDTVITVEGRPQTEKGFRAGLGGLGHLIRDKLKEMHSPTSSQMTEEEREQLTLEQSRLEREVRKLKRIADRSKHEQKRLDDLTARIAKISNKLGNNVTPSQGMSPTSNGVPSRDGSGSSSHTAPSTGNPTENGVMGNNRLKARKSVLFRHNKNDKQNRMQDAAMNETKTQTGTQEDDFSLDTAQAMSPTSGKEPTSSKSTHSKRKKGWKSIEAGVASLKALGKTMRGGGPGKTESSKHETTSPDTSVGKTSPRDSPVSKEGNAFSEAAQRVAKRGEQLNAAAEGSEQMANDASDMLDAVRALRQRNQKGGFFS